MVRTRSGTHLDRIFLNLCTSPEVRAKLAHSRNPSTLPSLKPIRSNSCSDLTELAHDIAHSALSNENPSEEPNTLDLTTTFHLPYLTRKPSDARTQVTSPVPLAPMESTGFVVQPSNYLTSRSISLFETTLINTDQTFSDTRCRGRFSLFRPSFLEEKRIETSDDEHSSLYNTGLFTHRKCSVKEHESDSSSTFSKIDLLSTDYTHRLQERQKSREHLRKSFLS